MDIAFMEQIAAGFERSRQEWRADPLNRFKDGRFLAYDEARRALAKDAESEDLADALHVIAKGYEQARTDWVRDRKDEFKDGRMLGYYEMLQMIRQA